jgi:hypothetical protein
MKTFLLGMCLCLVVGGLTNLIVYAHDVGSLAGFSGVSARDSMIVALRNEGPSGLQKALHYRDKIEQSLVSDDQQPQVSSQAVRESAESRVLLEQAIDQIAGQRYGSFSKLYWYTDWDKAVAAAGVEKKPILVLKLLGNLTDEFSCANSRFFRTTLYVDPSISNVLRDKYVLYWSSVRPVPKISIDFGDGRKLERTITGNSAHYIVDAQGTVIDCLPGLNSPTTFRNWLNEVAEIAHRLSSRANDPKLAEIARYHRNHLLAGNLSELPQIAGGPSSEPTQAATLFVNQPAFPTAKAAMPLAVSKGRLELPLVMAIQPDATTPTGAAIETTSQSEQQWSQKIAPVILSQESLQILRLENPVELQRVLSAKEESSTGPDSEQAVSQDNMLAALCKTIGDDEKINQRFHHALHGWLAENPTKSLDELNERVYAELFLTPSSDPWLGLVNQDAYTGLMHGGLQWK